jgi:hypothetical protein
MWLKIAGFSQTAPWHRLDVSETVPRWSTGLQGPSPSKLFPCVVLSTVITGATSDRPGAHITFIVAPEQGHQ